MVSTVQYLHTYLNLKLRWGYLKESDTPVKCQLAAVLRIQIGSDPDLFARSEIFFLASVLFPDLTMIRGDTNVK